MTATPDNSRVPNLDAMPTDELRAFARRHDRGLAFRALFPNGGTGTRRYTGSLASYAWNTVVARQARLAGNIATAIKYERIADKVYAHLPDWARW